MKVAMSIEVVTSAVDLVSENTYFITNSYFPNNNKSHVKLQMYSCSCTK